MEKFSAFRDPGTGIQPFLPPVPPSENDLWSTLLAPVRVTFAVSRSLVVMLIAVLHFILANVLCTLLTPVPPLHRLVEEASTRTLSRLALFVLGFLWIPEEKVARKRGNLSDNSWSPKAGDIIVSNWSSWIDILWLSYRFNPIFILPIAEGPEPSVSPAPDGETVSYRPGRKMGTGSAAISAPARTISPRLPICGFRRMSLLSMIRATGRTPQSPSSSSFTSLEDIRQSAGRPVVVFPECTTSNGRGLLRFARVFEGYNVPVKECNVFIMCTRYNPPTIFQPSLTHSIPSSALNPLYHLFTIAGALSPQSMAVRMLPLSESPSSQLFVVSEVVPDLVVDTLSEVCAILIARIGKMKRIGLGWEDKVSFLDLFSGRRK
ncbi:hypothetical protein L210DRAFT_3437783 [Boletus edulis BED1]|uniref:Phospholipid/glycerol acyltransferase domain-containing protein n=1 Tax=Boletus edulis BED1 TaxID=1328754 RepID=A0AAD4C683_BOLED|nr:hypothetical protein L210DRAFT_3437783 [Boletus edulis BED1]